jgi:hypothetical protein
VRSGVAKNFLTRRKSIGKPELPAPDVGFDDIVRCTEVGSDYRNQFTR